MADRDRPQSNHLRRTVTLHHRHLPGAFAPTGREAWTRSTAQLPSLEKRYELGQVSELTLLELKNTRTETNSSLTSLSLQIDRLKAQLSTLVGESPTQQLTLQPLPRVTQEQLDAMDFEADLETAKQNSLDLYLRQKEVDDAKEAWDDAPSGYQKDMAEHNYNAIVYTKDAAIQSFELAFFNLSVSVSDNAQLLEAARSALEFAQKDYEAALVKHERGMISDNELATQQETLEAAASKVDSRADQPCFRPTTTISGPCAALSTNKKGGRFCHE